MLHKTYENKFLNYLNVKIFSNFHLEIYHDQQFCHRRFLTEVHLDQFQHKSFVDDLAMLYRQSVPTKVILSECRMMYTIPIDGNNLFWSARCKRFFQILHYLDEIWSYNPPLALQALARGLSTIPSIGCAPYMRGEAIPSTKCLHFVDNLTVTLLLI